MKTVRVKDRIAAEIKQRIVGGMYPPGGKIPSERQLAVEFRTSCTAVSQALSDVEQAGFVEKRRGRGIHVLAPGDRRLKGAVGILVSGTAPAAELTVMIQAAQQTLARLNCHSEMCCIPPPGESDTAALARRYGGLLFIEGLGFGRLIAEIEARRFPCVVAKLEKDWTVSCTWVDHSKTTRVATRLLASLGHRRIALLIRTPGLFFYSKALDGYRRGLEQAGLPWDDSLVVTMDQKGAVEAYVAMRDFLARRRDFTAVVAARDYLASGAFQALTEAGFRVGRDMSLFGFDDTSWPVEKPFLTTFREPDAEMARVAVEMLVRRMIHGWRPVERREIEAPLVLRRSVGPGPDGLSATAPHVLLRFCEDPA